MFEASRRHVSTIEGRKAERIVVFWTFCHVATWHASLCLYLVLAEIITFSIQEINQFEHLVRFLTVLCTGEWLFTLAAEDITDTDVMQMPEKSSYLTTS